MERADQSERCHLPINGLDCGAPLPCEWHPPIAIPRGQRAIEFDRADRPSKAIDGGMYPYSDDFGRLVQ